MYTRKKGLREGKKHTDLWRIMLDSNIVKNNKLLFDTNLSLGEDTNLINTYLLFSTSVGILKETLYYLRIREESANVTNSQNSFLMVKNKEKLIVARKETDVHEYWQRTLIFMLYNFQ